MDLYSQEIQEKKKYLQNQPQMINKMAIGIYISIITLNINVLNNTNKRHSQAEWIQKQTYSYQTLKMERRDKLEIFGINIYIVLYILEKAMATHSSILAWTIPWTEVPGRLESMKLQTVEHD